MILGVFGLKVSRGVISKNLAQDAAALENPTRKLKRPSPVNRY
jgi:hypothetical protein